MLLIEKIITQIEQSKASNLIAEANKIVNAQHVLTTRLSDGFMMARIKDAQGKIFTVHANLKQWQPGSNKCTCEQGIGCVHFVAALISWLGRQWQLKKEEPAFKYDWLNKTSGRDDAVWQADLSGDALQGFKFSLAIQHDNQDWNIADILVHLLETHSYQSLLAKDDNMILQIMNKQQKSLQVSWGRLKWLLQRMLDEQLKASHSLFRIKNDWQVLKQVQQWSDKHQLWHSNDAWKKMLWLLEPNLLLLEDCKPKNFNGSLRNYQLEGVRWLTCLQRAGYGGILADDMGLGKTIQTLAYLLRLKEQEELNRPALVVVPTSLIANWQYECQEYTPLLTCHIFHGRSKLPKKWHEADLIITSYGMVQRNKQLFFDYHFSHVILDEAQLIKNFQSQKTQILKNCRADIKFCLSGTPMENHLGELWSLIDFAVPNLLGARNSFKKDFQKPIETTNDSMVQQRLLARIQPFMLRRTKQQVIDNLPNKTTIIHKVNLDTKQLELYETVRCILADKVQMALAEKGLLKSRWVVLDALLKLRQICCDPRLLPHNWQVDEKITSAKLDNLLAMLDNLIAEGRSVLVFSQFTKMLQLIEQELIKRNYTFQTLTGKTQKREQLVEKFQAGEVPIFLLSLKAGGLGLNLTKADTVIHFEPWWNPAVTAQATDRIYRIGQEQPVFEYHFIATGTIEESMLELQKKKHKLFDDTVSGAGFTDVKWTEADIMKFFAPL